MAHVLRERVTLAAPLKATLPYDPERIGSG
jgi:hypothetical protein